MSAGPYLDRDGLTFRYADGDSYQCADRAEVAATCATEARLWAEAAERFEWEAGREWYAADDAADFRRLAAGCRRNARRWEEMTPT
jgi:hypothetical protein